MRRFNAVYRLCFVSVFAALYLILAKLTIHIGSAHLSFASLCPIFLVTAVSFPDGRRSVFIGQILGEIIGGTLTLTTPLWILPPILRISLIGIVAVYYRKKGDTIFSHLFVYFFVILTAGIITSLANTGVEYLDALIRGYPFTYVFLQRLKRIGISLLTSIVISIRNLPLSKAYLRFSKQDNSNKKQKLTKGLKKTEKNISEN